MSPVGFRVDRDHERGRVWLLRWWVCVLVFPLSAGQLCAAEKWPPQPIGWPKWWVVELELSHPGFYIGWTWIRHATVKRGGIISSPGPALFFPAQRWVEDFEQNGNIWKEQVHLLAARRVLLALEDISAVSDANGVVVDEQWGRGFVLWQSLVEDNHAVWRQGPPVYLRHHTAGLSRPKVTLRHAGGCPFGSHNPNKMVGGVINPCVPF